MTLIFYWLNFVSFACLFFNAMVMLFLLPSPYSVLFVSP